MIVDSSALVAVLKDEAGAPALRHVLAFTNRVEVGAATVLETSVVVGPSRHGDLDALLAAVGAVVIPFTADHARIAREAYARFGRGSGSPARLNLGDAFSYATAVLADAPLLFKGDDFIHTDVRRVEPLPDPATS